MTGYLIEINTQTKRGLIEQAHNKRRFEFPLSAWEADFKDISANLEVEFEFDDNKAIRVVRPKKDTKQPFKIRQTRSIEECIDEHFATTKDLIKEHKKDIDPKKDLDFLRVRRFLFTAYNNLFELDNSISSAALTHLKLELETLSKEYDFFMKKISYSPQYSYEKIFLARQVEFVKLQEHINTMQSNIQSITSQHTSLEAALTTAEEHFAKRTDTRSAAYLQALNDLKKLRKRYVDLLHNVSLQKDKLAKAIEAKDAFFGEFFEDFLKEYLPLTNALKSDFIKILNAKASNLDALLWERAKQSPSIQRFFTNSRITGTYSSKTFLKYYLQNLDHNKIRNEVKELFELLKYIETFSQKNILLIQKSPENSRRYKEALKNFDNDLQITTSNNPRNHLSISNPINYHVIIMEWEVHGMNILSFIQKYLEFFSKSVYVPKFCVIIPRNTRLNLEKIQEKGISHYTTEGNLDQFIDMMRMIL